MSLTEMMRRDWDDRARQDAFHYIASWQKDWNLDDFLASGKHDYETLVTPILQRCRIADTGRTMAELGCGAGRMTPNFAARFEQVVALDLSAEMLQRARQIHSERSNILWLRVGGADLSCLPGASTDFLFSYLVLQHLPSDELVFGYVREMLRILRPGGGFLFQFNGTRKPTMNLRGRISWGLVDLLWSARLIGLSRKTAALFGLDPTAAGKSWRGVGIEANRVAAVVQSSGGEVREMSGENTPMTWCCGVKKAAG